MSSAAPTAPSRVGLLALLLVAASLVMVACSDDGSSGTGGTGLSAPGNGSVGTLEGTWEADDEPGLKDRAPVTLILSRTAFSLRIGDLTLQAEAQGPQFAAGVLRDEGDGQGPQGVEKRDATISRKSAEVGSLGAIPLPLTGGLRIDSGRADTFCQSTLVDGSVSASCGAIGDFGYLMPQSARKGTASGVRLSKSDSSFGDLGGTWQIGLSGGGSCTASFVQATVTATCVDADTHTGSFTIGFEGNRASGSTNEGIEFVAVRR